MSIPVAFPMRRLLCTGGFTAILGISLAQAQDATTANEPAALEEVVVTSQRREERLQDVPISVTALPADHLRERQILDVKALSGSVPGVAFAQTPGDPSDINIGIRGLFLQPSHIVFDPVVGIYVDGVYVSRTSGANTAFVDMDRVEVLRGPQGTLFGRNTIGGALNITTRKPTDRLEGSATIELGNYDTRNFTGVLNVPFLDSRAATRLVYQHQEHSGFGRDIFLQSDLSDLQQDYGRASLHLQATDDWSVLLCGDYMKMHNHSQLTTLGYVVPGGLADVMVPTLNGNVQDRLANYVGRDPFTTSADINPMIDVQVWSGTATIDGALQAIQLKSISGYREEDANRPGNNSGTPYPVFNLPDKPFNYHQFSQELQAYGDALGTRLNWITGLYYFRERGRQGQTVQALVPVNPASGKNDAIAENQSEGAFVQVSYELVSDLRLTGGLRYTEDRRSVVYLDRAIINATGAEICNVAPAIRDAPTLCQATPPEGEFSYVPYTIGADYKPRDDMLLYAKLSKGFRSGGFLQGGAASPIQIQPYGPEDLLSREVGAKLELLDRRLRFNAAAFHAKYGDIQQTAFVPGPGGLPVGITANVGTARLWGGELEANAIIDRVQLRAGLGYVDPKYTEGPLVGVPFIQVPKTTWSLGGVYSTALPGGTLKLGADYIRQSEVHWFPPTNVASLAPQINAAATAATTQSAYGLLNAQISFEFSGTPAMVSLWGRNLTDTTYTVRAADYVMAGLGIVPWWMGDPRTYGASLTYRFGVEQ